jgi:hypothetical protein
LGIVAVPVNVGLAMFALRLSAVVTNAVVASFVDESPGDCVTPVVAVGKLGVPLNVGLARAARVVSVGWT